MIGCHDAMRQLWEYLDGTLEDPAHIEEHLERCLRCCAEMEFAHELRRLLAAPTTTDIPADVLLRLNSVLDALEETDR
jgi:hypothetical protein